MDLDRICTLCLTLRFQGNHERDLQEALEPLLKAACSEVIREAELTARSRIDFLIGTVGLEVKVDSSATTVIRQLLRYAESPRIEALVLVTTRAKHRTIPKTLGGKPVRVVWLPPF